MAIPNYSKYSITKHCKDRLKERFNVIDSEVEHWVQRFMTQAVYVSSERDNRQKWRKYDIVMVIDTKQKSIITVYGKSKNEDSVGGKPLNPELATKIKEVLNDYTSKKKRNLGASLAEVLQDMAEVSSKMVNPYTNFRYSDLLYDKLMQDYTILSDKIDSSQELLKESEEFKNNLVV